MPIKDKTYWELSIEINPKCADVLCDIIQSEFDCEGIITSEEKYTLPCAVYSLKGKDMVNYGLLGAGLALATFPMLIVYVLLSKRIQESFIVGAVKG